MEPDVRWKQRFDNFSKALVFLSEAVAKQNPSDLEKAGIIQAYEFTFELAWKTLMDFLQWNKVEVRYPKDTIKEAFRFGLIEEGEKWMDMLDKRNLMSHTYNETNAEMAHSLVLNNYFAEIKKLHDKLKTEL